MNLRPKLIKDIIGNCNIKERLNITLNSCKATNENCPHMLFYGPSGTGKTTFAQAIANELGYEIEIGNGSQIKSVKSLLPYLMRVKEKGILFIDEIHRLPIGVSEFLYVAIEEFRADLGKEGQMSIDLPEFTFIGATTNSGQIPKPLYDRFILHLPLQLYTIEELTEIISHSAKKLKVTLSDDAKKLIASSSRNTPRIANNRLRWIRYYAKSKNINIIKEQDVLQALKLEGVNKDGVSIDDIKYIKALKSNQPCGLNTLTSLTNIAKDTIEEVIEPFLLMRNVIRKTSRGRILC